MSTLYEVSDLESYTIDGHSSDEYESRKKKSYYLKYSQRETYVPDDYSTTGRFKRYLFWCQSNLCCQPGIFFIFLSILPIVEFILYLCNSPRIIPSIPSQVQLTLSVFIHILSLISITGATMAFVTLKGKMPKQNPHWLIETIILCVLGFSSSIFLSYSFVAYTITLIEEIVQFVATYLTMIKILMQATQHLGELYVTFLTLNLLILNKQDLKMKFSLSKVAAAFFLMVLYLSWLFKSISRVNIYPKEFYDFISRMNSATSTLTLSIIRPCHQMLLFRGFAHFGGYVWNAMMKRISHMKSMVPVYFLFNTSEKIEKQRERRARRALIDSKYLYESDSDDENKAFRPNQRLITPLSIFALVFCGFLINVNWIQANFKSFVSVSTIGLVVEGIVFLVMTLWSFVYLVIFLYKHHEFRTCTHYCDMTKYYFALILMTVGSLVAYGSNIATIYVSTNTYIILIQITTMLYILVHAIVVIYIQPKGIFRMMLMIVDLAFIYYALADEGHHVENAIIQENSSPMDKFIVSIFWVVLEYYLSLLEYMCADWLDDIFVSA
mmetsp:Transcript_7019/g.10313  ORF Transcript_7019/g.10313 Transcript_7019/m.10313 type:complete len:552 (+) Transcript_7019:73-1728(+)